MLKLKVLATTNGVNLRKATDGSVGLDIQATTDPIIFGNTITYKTGLIVEPPEGYYLKVYPRSSIRKTDLILCNSVGIIDPDYRGEIEVSFKLNKGFLYQRENNPHTEVFMQSCGLSNYNIYKKGDFIAQLILEKINSFEIEVVEFDSFSKTQRGSSGFGSSDKGVNSGFNSHKC